MNHSLKYLTGLIICSSTAYGAMLDLISIQVGASTLSTVLGDPKDLKKLPLMQRESDGSGTTSTVSYARQSLTGGVSINFGPRFRMVAEAYLPSDEEIIAYDGIPDPTSTKIQINHTRLTSLAAENNDAMFLDDDDLFGSQAFNDKKILIVPRANLRGRHRLNGHTLELRGDESKALDFKQEDGALLAMDADFMITATAGESKLKIKPNMVVALRGEFILGQNAEHSSAIGFSILNTADEYRYTCEGNAQESSEHDAFGSVENPGLGDNIYVAKRNATIAHGKRSVASEKIVDKSKWWYGVTTTTSAPINDFLMVNGHLGYYVSEFKSQGTDDTSFSLFTDKVTAECFVGSLSLTYRFID